MYKKRGTERLAKPGKKALKKKKKRKINLIKNKQKLISNSFLT